MNDAAGSWEIAGSLRAARRRLDALADATDWGDPDGDERFLQASLEEVMRRLDSPVAFLHELETAPDGGSMTTVRGVWPAAVMERCGLAPGAMVGSLDRAGLWADAVRRRRPVIYNDYPSARERRGLPHGHVELTRVLVVPVERARRVEVAVGVGNRATPYTTQDALVLQILADTLWDLRERARGDWNSRRLLSGERVVTCATRAALSRDDSSAGFVEALGALREGLGARAVVLGRVAPGGQVRLELAHTQEGGRHLRPPITLPGEGPHQGAIAEGQVVLANALPEGRAVYEELRAALFPAAEPPRRGLFAPIALPGGAGGAPWGLLGAFDGPRRWDALDSVLARRVAEVLALAVSRQREQAHRARVDARLHAVFEHLADGSAVLDPQSGRLVLVNPALATLLGRPADTLEGLTIQDFVGRVPYEPRLDLFDLIADDLRRILDGEVVRRHGVPMPRPDGEVRHVDITGVAVPWGEGRAVLALLRDVTELQQARARSAQEDRLASLGSLAAGVAHEINNPLTYILTFLDTVARQAPAWGVPHIEKDARDSLRGAQQIARLAKGLLTYGRAQDDATTLVDLREPLESAVTLAHNALKHRARLTKSYALVPRVRAVEGQITQVALNLLMNAAHAIPEGDIVRDHEVRLELWTEEDRVCFAVEDTGTGIAPHTTHRIFDPFFTTKAPGRGTGLGLSLSRDLVMKMGGEISVESPTARGREAIATGSGLAGSRFTVRLPAASLDQVRARPGNRLVVPTPPPVAPDEPPPAATAHGTAAASAPRRSLLIVDDEPALLRSLGRLLALDFDVTTAATGEEALAQVMGRARAGGAPARAPFDLVLCDIQMPGISGIDVHRALRDKLPAQARRFALMTGGVDRPGVEAAINEHAIPRLHKPFSLDTIAETLGQLMDERGGDGDL